MCGIYNLVYTTCTENKITVTREMHEYNHQAYLSRTLQKLTSRHTTWYFVPCYEVNHLVQSEAILRPFASLL